MTLRAEVNAHDTARLSKGVHFATYIRVLMEFQQSGLMKWKISVQQPSSRADNNFQHWEVIWTETALSALEGCFECAATLIVVINEVD